MLQQPPLPDDESHHAARMYVDDKCLIAELNAVALANFRWSLWFLATTCPRGEDIDIWSSEPPAQNQEHTSIGYCEITLTGEGPVFGKLHNPNAEILHRGDRVDFSVNRLQAEQAYQNLEALSGEEIGQEAILFGRLIVRVV